MTELIDSPLMAHLPVLPVLLALFTAVALLLLGDGVVRSAMVAPSCAAPAR